MALCDSGCYEPLPKPYSNACGVDPLPGGINRIAFLTCDTEFIDIADQTEWDALLASGDAVLSGELLGSKPKGTSTKKRVSSCSPERVIGAEKSIVFQDNNRSETHGSCSIYEFWNTINENPKAFRVVYFTCDGWAYGPIDDFVIEVDDIIEDANTGIKYIDGIIGWNNKYMDLSLIHI